MNPFSQEIAQSYRSLMYKEIAGLKTNDLATGDVFKLDKAFFQKFAKHPSIVPIIESFLDNPKYSSGLWAILNKPCDMVHDVEGNRTFDRNLFLCPLRNFLSCFANNGPLSDCIQKTTKEIDPVNKIINMYDGFTKGSLARQYPFDAKASPEDKTARNAAIKAAKHTMNGFFEKILPKETTGPEVVPFLKKYSKTEKPELVEILDLNAFITETEISNDWLKYLARLEANEGSEIRIKKSKLDKISNLVLNQWDSSGIFFYEPHSAIVKDGIDISYVIELEDMITLKIDSEKRRSGELVGDLMTQARVLMLEDNFSDRLLNLMGNYFSKIGTKDVASAPILKIYETCMGDKFKVVEEEKKEKNCPHCGKPI